MNPDDQGRPDRGDDQLRDELGRELHHRAEAIHDAPLTLGDVKGRAGAIRRTRRLAAAVGVVAVAALVVPVAVFAGNGLDRTEGPGPATTGPSATQSPTGTPTRAVDPNTPSPTATPAGDLTTYSLNGDLAAGPPPAVPYLDGNVLVASDADPMGLPRRYDQFALLGGTVLGVYSDVAGDRLLESYTWEQGGFDAVGTTVAHGEVAGGIVVSDDGTTVAWATPDGAIETLWAGGGVRLADGLGAGITAEAVRGDGSCFEVDGGCQVFLDGPAYDDAPRAADSHGIVDLFAPGAVGAGDVSSTGLLALVNSVSDDGSCSGVYDEDARSYAWKTCDYSFLEFSPGGGHLLATAAYRDGFGLTYVTVLDTAGGEPVVEFDIDRGAILQAGWEDDEHLLAVTYDDADGWRVLRLGLDGSRALVAGPDRRSSQDERPFFLPGRP